jgi:sugar/nucleoside kinase (ribokinase family)
LLISKLLNPLIPKPKKHEKHCRFWRPFSKEKDFGVPAIPVEVVDNTGAGDVYNAGFITGLFLGKSLEESALFATKVAAKSVTGYGRDRYPTEEDLKNFLR